MSALALSSVLFLLVLGGIFIGTAFRRALPENHLSKETQDVVRLGASNDSRTSPWFINWRRKRLVRHKEQSSQTAYSQRYSARQSVGTVRRRGHAPPQRVEGRNKSYR